MNQGALHYHIYQPVIDPNTGVIIFYRLVESYPDFYSESRSTANGRARYHHETFGMAAAMVRQCNNVNCLHRYIRMIEEVIDNQETRDQKGESPEGTAADEKQPTEIPRE